MALVVAVEWQLRWQWNCSGNCGQVEVVWRLLWMLSGGGRGNGVVVVVK